VIINPLLAERQAHGGLSQGVGQARCAEIVCDESGQLLTGSFMDLRATINKWLRKS